MRGASRPRVPCGPTCLLSPEFPVATVQAWIWRPAWSWLKTVLSRPYPSQEIERYVGGGALDRSGPEFHIVTVAVSEVLVDASAERWAEVEDALSAMRGARRVCVGEPLGFSPPIRLWRRHRPSHQRQARFVRPSRPWRCSEVDFWQRDARTICVGVGQWDKEFPMQLALIVGDLHLSVERERPGLAGDG
jgi:hypothetical protein